MHSRLLRGVGLGLLLLGTAEAGGTVTYSNIYSFGDSLTDVGNVAGVTTPGTSPVINGYYNEEEFSDGILWNQYLTNYWGATTQTPGRGNTTTQTPLPGGNDWAYGGSEAGNGTVQPTGVTQPIPNLLTETSQYLTYNTPDRSALYTVWSGADNLLVGGDISPAAAAAAADAVKTALEDLESAGARHFLVFNMPKLGDTPYAQALGPIGIAATNEYSDSYNAALDVDIAELDADPLFLGDIHVADTYALLEQVVAAVNADGSYTPDFFVPGGNVTITNVTDEALDYFDANGTYPTNYLFWDDVHPTTETDDVIAGLALQALPEPGVWAWAAGVAAAGLAGWRKWWRRSA